MIHPKIHSKEEFLNTLTNINTNNNIIKKFISLPENISYNNHKYDLYINVIWYNINNTFYNFELNYYSDELIEFLFPLKVYNDVELSINNLICNLIDKKL